jgi:VCBS repeat-containing protein
MVGIEGGLTPPAKLEVEVEILAFGLLFRRWLCRSALLAGSPVLILFHLLGHLGLILFNKVGKSDGSVIGDFHVRRGASNPHRGVVFRDTCDAPGENGAVAGCIHATGASPPQTIGNVPMATGPIAVTTANGDGARVKAGEPVRGHDPIETTTATAARVTFTDGNAFSLSNDAGMTPKEFVRDPNRTSNSARLGLNKGAFTFTAGKITKSGGLRIDTPVARIRGTLQDRGISTLTLALTFSVIDKMQAASWPNAFLDDDAAAYKDLAHGTYEIIMKKDGRIFRHEDPGETIVVDPTGEVARIPNSSSRMADLQNFQQAALATLSQGPQGAAAGGSSTETFNAPLQLLPINFIRPDNGAVQNQVTLNAAPATSGFIEVVQLKQPPPPAPSPPTPPPVLTAEQEAHQIIEVPHITGSTALDIAPSTTLTFTDLKLSAVSASLASITWSGGTTLPSELVAVLANALSVTADAADTAGSITATFSAADKNFDFLAANETLTVVYTVTTADTNGVTLAQPVTITIAGSNDPPVLSRAPIAAPLSAHVVR